MTTRRGFIAGLIAAIVTLRLKCAPKPRTVQFFYCPLGEPCNMDFSQIVIGQWADYADMQWDIGDGYLETGTDPNNPHVSYSRG